MTCIRRVFSKYKLENVEKKVQNSGGYRRTAANLLFGQFSPKLHENEEILGGGRPSRALHPPMKKVCPHHAIRECDLFLFPIMGFVGARDVVVIAH